jgi:hypothetical protein
MSHARQIHFDAIVVDTNVFMLLLVGSVDMRYITQHKRTQKYDPEAWALAKDFIARFRSVITT